MNARIFSSLSDPDLAAALLQGAVGVIPTDTVYGLVAKASESSAIDRLYRTKPRPLQPGTIIGSCLADFEELGFRADELELCNKFWPAAISVVLNATNVAHFLKKKSRGFTSETTSRCAIGGASRADWCVDDL